VEVVSPIMGIWLTLSALISFNAAGPSIPGMFQVQQDREGNHISEEISHKSLHDISPIKTIST